MKFWFKKRKLVLDLFTSSQTVFDSSKPRMAMHFYPNWWRELKQEIPTTSPVFTLPTMRGCMGMIDHYKYGLILPMWTDFKIELGEINTEYFSAHTSDQVTPVIYHDPRQRGGFAPANQYCHIKLESPWSAKCKEPIHFKWEQPTWNMHKPECFTVLPATVDFFYQPYLQVHLLFNRSQNKVIRSIDFGTPLAHLTPLTERTLELRYHLISPAEHAKFFTLSNRISFSNSYKKYRRAVDSDSKGCPYS